MSEKKITIECIPNGPYKATGLTEMQSSTGSVKAPVEAYLCRCGGSKNKPFCDGTHNKNGFTSDKQEDRVPDLKEDFTGDGIKVSDNRGTCAHAGYCTNGLPSVFRQKEEPFVDASGADSDEIVKTILQCPSGALRFEKSGATDKPGQESIFIAPNGPYACANVEVKGVQFNQGANPDRLTLCRCGQSKNKPFCNGAHWDHQFDENVPK